MFLTQCGCGARRLHGNDVADAGIGNLVVACAKNLSTARALCALSTGPMESR
jgi:hypothetical protein